jgi:hypothetical protein
MLAHVDPDKRFGSAPSPRNRPATPTQQNALARVKMSLAKWQEL